MRGAASALVATLFRNFAAYAAAPAGYTAAIIASDQLGATGGPNGDAFMLAVTRVSEIGIGIVCAGVVLAATDHGGARRVLARRFAALSAAIAARFTAALVRTGAEMPDARKARHGEGIGRFNRWTGHTNQALGRRRAQIARRGLPSTGRGACACRACRARPGMGGHGSLLTHASLVWFVAPPTTEGPPTRATSAGMSLAGTAPVGAASYEPRTAEGTILHRVVREHLESV